MDFRVTSVSPGLAKTWLKSNTYNRRLSKPHVKKLANEMINGRWVLNGETISFDSNGTLLNGQHRLSAVIESGVTVEMVVAIGVEDRRAFDVTDVVSLKRGVHQVADMKGIKNPNTVTSVARIVLAFDNSSNMDEFSMIFPSSYQGDPGEVVEKSGEIQDDVINIKEKVGRAVLRSAGSPATFIAILYILKRYNNRDFESFCEKIRTGIFESENDPCMMLRDRVLKGRGGFTSHAWKSTLAAITIKAFNAHSESKKIKNLRWRVDGNNPERFPSIRKL